MKNKLWTKDFSFMTAATTLAIIGGEAMNLPISLLVFEETQSTFLSSIVMICGMLPDVILPIFIAPMIDKGSKKKWLVTLDILQAISYLIMGIWITGHSFSYALYIVFVLVVGTISVFTRLTYNSWYPDLIPIGSEQKGFAVSATIYPFVTIVMAPVATFMYQSLSMSTIFFIITGITIVSTATEGMINEVAAKAKEKYTFERYKSDIKEGFTYIRKEKGIRNIYTYMSITNGVGHGISNITQAYYQSTPLFTVTMLGFLKSAEMLGRVLSGLFQYTKQIPVEKRYALTKFVYAFYDLSDAFALFMPYPFMLVDRFICGALGTTTATIRETAVMSYLPTNMRARVNALFNVFFSVGGVMFQLIAGMMGQYMSYRSVALILGLFTGVVMVVFIVIPKKENKPIYEAERKA